MATEATKVSKIPAPPIRDPLESLRSPRAAIEFVEKPPGRESVAESDFNDIALDDDSTFSPVSLTGQSFSSDGTPLSGSLPETMFNPSKQFLHKKSASTTTIRSSKNLPFLLSRLEIPEESGRSHHRGSVDGQQKLQEEFARLHKEEEETRDTVTSSAIDWGASSDCSVSWSFVRAMLKSRLLGSGDIWYDSMYVRDYSMTHTLRKTIRVSPPNALTSWPSRLRRVFRLLFVE